MRRLKILTWHIHGSYLNTLSRIDHDWFLPVKPGRPEAYGGRGPTFQLPEYVYEVPVAEVPQLDLDLILYQAPRNYLEDQYEILSDAQLRLPKIYLEHNTPRPHPTDSRHPVDDPDILLVHVTQYNRLMWDSGRTPTSVIEHSVALNEAIRYRGELRRGLTAANCIQQRPRIAGYDIFLQARERVPLDIVGLQSEAFGGLGDIPYYQLHQRMADYRFLFSPMRYTSLPLAVIEAMTLGMPIVALATTALPDVLEHGKSGYLSCDVDELYTHMQHLLDDQQHARRMGEQAQRVARERFGLERFVRDWNAAFAEVIGVPARRLEG